MFDNISISGITALHKYPKINCPHHCKQCLHTNLLVVPCEKPDIESINDVKVSICIDEFHIINTILGPKIILNGTKNVKIIYTANNCRQSVHSSEWELPFCDFILIKDISYDNCLSLINDLFVGVEHVCINNCDCRFIDVCIIFIICPIIKSQYYDCYKKHYNPVSNNCPPNTPYSYGYGKNSQHNQR